MPVTPKIERIGKQALFNIREQARVQLEGRNSKQPIYEFLEPIEPERGLAKLPLPSVADIFLDFESAPFAFGDGLEYLFGVMTIPGGPSAEPNYDAMWALNRAEEKKAFEKFMTLVMERWAETPEMHIYHYTPYEQTAIKRLAGRHSCFVDEVDRLLRGGVFVDLYQVVRQGLRASVESYSIKKMEPFYGFTRDRALPEATRALESLEAFFSLGETKADLGVIRDTVEEYNRDDCVSALRLREWLEGLRREVETQTGIAVPRPAPKESAATEDLTAQIERVTALANKLRLESPKKKRNVVMSNKRAGCSLTCLIGIVAKPNLPGGSTTGSGSYQTANCKRTRTHSVAWNMLRPSPRSRSLWCIVTGSRRKAIPSIEPATCVIRKLEKASAPSSRLMVKTA